jgi:hypothetical protein
MQAQIRSPMRIGSIAEVGVIAGNRDYSFVLFHKRKADANDVKNSSDKQACCLKRMIT